MPEPPVAAPDHAEIKRAAETLRDACLAVERSAGQSVSAERRMDAAERWLRDLLPAETVLALLAERQQLRDALEQIATDDLAPTESEDAARAVDYRMAARAVLAGEGDATHG